MSNNATLSLTSDQLHDTYYVVAHSNYLVSIGALMFAVFALAYLARKCTPPPSRRVLGVALATFTLGAIAHALQPLIIVVLLGAMAPAPPAPQWLYLSGHARLIGAMLLALGGATVVGVSLYSLIPVLLRWIR